MTNLSSDKVRGKLETTPIPFEQSGNMAHGVKEKVRTYVQTGKGNLKFGIVEDKFVEAHWFLENAGRCEWIMSQDEPRMKRRGDPKYIKREKDSLLSMLESEGVHVVFFGGCHPPKDTKFWRNKDLKGVVWVTKRRALGSIRIPSGWSVCSKRVTHSNVGGVTTGASG
mmetsp:Transcript_6949/g.10553  ORF Transcript_6949/g.10553 Transcript_6949/m.10553 type:complete len:168 (+) Transcript_6949:538-1041(+)